MRVAVVGLGSIAQRAYLPILTALENVELVLCSRNRERLSHLAARYRIREAVASLTDLSSMQVDAAFVHAATEAHEDIVSFLLRQGIDVYVDKPLAYTMEASARLVALSESTGRFLMVGFNRRYAPMYRSLADQPGRRIVLLQKNRRGSPDVPRRVIFDDFVHVVDTLRFLSPGPVSDIKVSGYVNAGKLHHVLLQLGGSGFHLVGSMNRDSGGTEVREGYHGSALAQDALQTHALCEQIVTALG